MITIKSHDEKDIKELVAKVFECNRLVKEIREGRFNDVAEIEEYLKNRMQSMTEVMRIKTWVYTDNKLDIVATNDLHRVQRIYSNKYQYINGIYKQFGEMMHLSFGSTWQTELGTHSSNRLLEQVAEARQVF